MDPPQSRTPTAQQRDRGTPQGFRIDLYDELPDAEPRSSTWSCHPGGVGVRPQDVRV